MNNHLRLDWHEDESGNWFAPFISDSLLVFEVAVAKPSQQDIEEGHPWAIILGKYWYSARTKKYFNSAGEGKREAERLVGRLLEKGKEKLA